MNKGFVLWFTGLSGSGKSTLSKLVEERLLERGVKVEVLDGDEVRTNLSKGLGFSKEDRDTNIRRIGYVAKLLSRNGVCAITAAISPYREIRDEVRKSVEERAAFVEVYCECSIEKLTERDVKGLYKKALAGEIKNFTGVSDPYEPPLNPEVVCKTGEESVETSLNKIIKTLEMMKLIPVDPSADYTEEEEEEVAKRLKDLGYLG
ncbi:MAG: adenylyl-sulfate kinase [Thermoanaerobaculaceae bacterium]|nr:adenylyl-sulfate kinase [Thermoanaerobaculaceae bacterium]